MYPGAHSRVRPNHPAIIMAGSGAVTSYAQLEDQSARLARFLREAGLNLGDGVALLTENSPESLIVYWAAVRCGLYITPLNHHLTEAEIAALLAHGRPKALIASARFVETMAAASAASNVLVSLVIDGEHDGFSDYRAALASVSSVALVDQPRGADMLYSSGTTGGRPKGIRPPLPDRQVDEPGDPMVDTFGPYYSFGPDTVYLSPAPLYHGGPIRFAILALALGSTVVVMERFEPEKALQAIQTYRITHSQWVPTMFVRMLKLPAAVRDRYDLATHRYAIHSSAPCPVEVKHELMRWWGPIVYEYYSSQEAAGITMLTPREWLEHPGSVGRPVLGEIRICDELGEVLPVGSVGVIYFARDRVTFEYFEDPELTAAAQHPAHQTWTTAGDIGYVDADGFLYLTDRKAFMIISGGVNIYPQEVEDLLALHPAVEDVAVIGVADDDLGEAVKAVVIPAAGYVGSPELAAAILGFVAERVARYKVPRSLDFVESLPRTPTGKLIKGKLVERYRTLATH